MPAQRLITPAEYIDMTDDITSMLDVLLAASGDEDTPATAAAYAAAVRNTIVAFDQPDEAQITADLIDAAIAMVAGVTGAIQLQSYVTGFNSAILTHLGQDLNAWLEAGLLRVKPNFRLYGNTTISPVNVFPPATILGAFAVTGDGAGAFTPDATSEGAIDTSLFADAQLEVEVINQQLGAAQIVVTVEGLDFDGAAQSHTATITAEALVGAKFDIGTSADRFASVTDVTITGGTNGDDFQVQSKVDR